ncbi:MAG: hypothetical protein BGO69_11005 [Bacteroidetes bacterium 46-16]|nr:MAG: hypothetical protein BGO69_11005 [Bacteroidetes bacterium 46-16]
MAVTIPGMVIPDEQLEQFRGLYKARYGTEISKELAYEQGMKLICLLKRIYKPMTKEAFETITQKRMKILPAVLAGIASRDRDGMV